MTTDTLADLAGENAFLILGRIGRLLGQLERANPDMAGLRDRYISEAQNGDYEHLCAVSEEYAVKYLADTLHAREGDLTG